ncbi:hypothetical protein SCAR479_00803 [Seiridium cardinale]|uniref:Uncharacterized protein n=1 Tax=Seiridium cardinale TaxID=138064 RepID=A0ABR2Y6V8_9PEZI
MPMFSTASISARTPAVQDEPTHRTTIGPGSTDRNFAELNDVIACLPNVPGWVSKGTLIGASHAEQTRNARTRPVSRHWLLPKIADVIPAAPIRIGLARAAERHKKPNVQENSSA